MKKLLVCLLAFTFIFSSLCTQTFAEGDISVFVDGNKVEFDVAPVINDGRTLVPVRAIFESIGAKVTWDDATKTVYSDMNDTKISLKINDNVLSKNGESIALDVPAKLIKDRTMVPVRAISEAYGCYVSWNDAKRTVAIITDPDKVEIANINGESISVAYFNYCLYQIESYAAQSFNCSLEDIKKMWGTGLDGTSFGEYIIDMAIDHISLLKSATQYAGNNKITLTGDEMDYVDEIIASIENELGSKEAFDEYMAMCGSTPKAAYDYYTENAYLNKIYEVLGKEIKASDKEIKKFLDEKYIRAKHILFATSGLSQEEVEEKKKLAEDVLKKLKSGSNFDKMLKTYGEDPGMEASPEGYLFTKGEMVQAFEDAAFKLEVGKLSPVVETEFGYHIIKRVAPNYTADELKSAGNMLAEDKVNSKVLDIKNASKISLSQGLIDLVVPVGI
jgi:hypothetical protein